ncbi:MAG TPA: hypothetical protein VGM37_13470 [Armatimonadota bacterium]|jgi:hypothetical protein
MNLFHWMLAAGCLCLLVGALGAPAGAARPREFDIAPFALPNGAPGELRFEEPRDIARVIAVFDGPAPANVELAYWRRIWPQTRIETGYQGADNAMSMGWFPIEDAFNGDWRPAKVNVARRGAHAVEITFQPLSREFPDCADYDAPFRRTQGIRIHTGGAVPKSIEVYTSSRPASTRLRVQLDAGVAAKAGRYALSGYNAVAGRMREEAGGRSFTVSVRHMTPAHRFCGDDGLVTFSNGDEAFTISLSALETEGPIWFADEGVFITRADDPTTFEQYRARNAGERTISAMVKSLPEQSLGGAMNGQPRPHPESFVAGCKNARQRFRIEPDGDIHMAKMSVDMPPMKDTPRFKNTGDARFFFGMERWRVQARFPDPEPVMAYNTRMLADDVAVEQKVYAVPLLKPMAPDALVGDDAIIGIARFTFRNVSDHSATAMLPISYSSNSGLSRDRMGEGGVYGTVVDANRLPLGPRDPLSVEPFPTDPARKALSSVWGGEQVMRCLLDTGMRAAREGDAVTLTQELAPGESCTATLTIPYIALSTPEELGALARLNPDAAYRQVVEFWQGIGKLGARIHTPEPRLNALYRAHFAHVSVADIAMPDDPSVINTSVGTSIYGNYTNESCMIVQELEERGLHEEARRRLNAWIKYQGTEPLLGNFSDHDGVLYGAGGFECGNTYDQHHGWALWRLAEHFNQTGDVAWLKANAETLVKAADWVFRQRRLTMVPLPNSRGWERGFLPAGSLEDVSDYFYWLSTNAVTWRAVDSAARALETIQHPDAPRLRREADAYRADLLRGFRLSRQHAPLVRLRNGRWVPHTPSRLYRRGRDVGWIRETLEGSVYLLITGLYDANSQEAGWILDDYQDNRYLGADYGYPVFDPKRLWYDVGGFSCQPNLLAGLMPYLDRDEPEVYIWMFFNAWAACYREEANAMVEHPTPILGHSNQATVKTSDQSNAVKWLTYMFVYAPENALFLGRALPREWLTDSRDIWAEGLSTRFGDVSVRYHADAARDAIRLEAELSLRRAPGRIVARFRHPNKKPIRSVTVNGAAWTAFDPVRGDVDITGLSGKLAIEAGYGG